MFNDNTIFPDPDAVPNLDPPPPRVKSLAVVLPWFCVAAGSVIIAQSVENRLHPDAVAGGWPSVMEIIQSMPYELSVGLTLSSAGFIALNQDVLGKRMSSLLVGMALIAFMVACVSIQDFRHQHSLLAVGLLAALAGLLFMGMGDNDERRDE